MALCPQWEANFEANSYSFRPGRSIEDAIEFIFLGILKKPKWVFYSFKCFDEINYQDLLNKCNTFPTIRKQIQSWLKSGILNSRQYFSLETGTFQSGVISPLLANIILNGLKEYLDHYTNTVEGYLLNNLQRLTFVRYMDHFILLHPNKKTLLSLKEVVQRFLDPIGLKLNSEKTLIVHSLNLIDGTLPGFTFLGFDVIQREKRKRQSKLYDHDQKKAKPNFVTLVTPSKDNIGQHRKKIRLVIQNYLGINQESLIKILNSIIQEWVLSKRSEMGSKIFQDLDVYVWYHLWKWCRKRHLKMPKEKLKNKYWYKIGKKNWIFAVKNKNNNIALQIQFHSNPCIQSYFKRKSNALPFDGTISYWDKKSKKKDFMTIY
jgi:RNA-directed DNA polymerase